jgi:rare lipoprotein A
VVRVNDRGPARWTGRDLDLSRGAAGASGLLKAGVGRVRVTRL